MLNLLVKSILMCNLIAVSSAPIGCFLIWRRMAIFGDTIAHASLLGVTIALIFAQPIELGAIVVSSVLISGFFFLKYNHNNDTVLSIIAYSSLAVADIIASSSNIRFNLGLYLFGDILSISSQDITIAIIINLLITIWISWRWNTMLIITISKEIAIAQQIKVKLIELEFQIIITIIVAFYVKTVGALLITALLIIPAASAKIFSKNPQEMIIICAIITVIASNVGIFLSYIFDLPVAPMIIVIALLIFITTNLSRLSR